MTTTFADYAAAAEARKDIELAVLGHTLALCEALRQNYLESAIRLHKRAIEKGESVAYHTVCLQQLSKSISPADFVVDTGRKYYKIIFQEDGLQRSAHAFVDKKTGEVYKPASWRGPAKGVRFDLRLIQDREWLLENAGWSGGYLYAR